jgi:hypothetical protein
MKKKFKSAYLLLSSILVSLISLPFAFAKSATGSKLFFQSNSSVKEAATGTMALTPVIKSVYDSLHLRISGLSRQAFDFAKKGLEKLTQQGKLNNSSIVAIADFSLPSTEKRLFVLDLKNYKVLFNTFVAHGKNSGREWANSFSNQTSSLKSSPGFYITHETYTGHNGYSLKLEGIEKGINDNAAERAIVMHGSNYVNESFANAKGYIGRSWGCPAVPAAEAVPIINTIKGGSCLFIYSPDQKYLSNSTVLNS